MTDTPFLQESLQDSKALTERTLRQVTGVNRPSLIASVITPAVYLHHTGVPSRGQSHQRGWPRGVTTWPHFEGRPQQFLLAIRLSELRDFELEGRLPPEGWLSFFMAPDVMTGEAPLTACTVTFTPDENAPALRPPTRHLTTRQEGLDLQYDLQYDVQTYEFATPDEYLAACDEEHALGYKLPDGPDSDVSIDPLIPCTDYLFGKQIYANLLGIESRRDVAAFTRQQHGRDDTRLRALLSLTDFNHDWPFFRGTDVLSLTFFIEESDLKAHRFDRVIVDVAMLP